MTLMRAIQDRYIDILISLIFPPFIFIKILCTMDMEINKAYNEEHMTKISILYYIMMTIISVFLTLLFWIPGVLFSVIFIVYWRYNDLKLQRYNPL
jgi:hypothetical protein